MTRFLTTVFLAVATGSTLAAPPVIRSVFTDADRVIVYSISPKQSKHSGIQGYPILKHSQFTETDDIQLIANDLFTAIEEKAGQAFCFIPHHAVRVIKGRNFYDFILCYACNNYHLYAGSKIIVSGSLGGSPTLLDELLKKDAAEQGAAANP